MNENFSYDELRELADMFATVGNKEMALAAVSDALEAAGYDPGELSRKELFYLAHLDCPGDSRLPRSPALIEHVVSQMRGPYNGTLLLKKGHPFRESMEPWQYNANVER